MKKLITILMLCLISIFFCNCDDDEDKNNTDLVNERMQNNFLHEKKPFNVDDENNFEFYVVADPHYGLFNISYLQNLKNEKIIPEYSNVFIDGDLLEIGNNNNFVVDNQMSLAVDDISKSTYNVFAVMGNHDFYVGYETWVNQFGPTAYDYIIGDTHIIILDTGNFLLGEVQTDWLENILSTSNTKNKIIITHIPYDTPNHNKNYTHGDYNIPTICKKYNVSLCIFGHDHLLETKIIDDTTYIRIGSLAKSVRGTVLKIKIQNNKISKEILL